MGKARRRKTHGTVARSAADSNTAVSSKESQPPQGTKANSANKAGTAGGQIDLKAGVLDGLTSLNPLARESSCAAIASLFEKIDRPEAGDDSWSAAQRLIAGGLVKKLLPRLVDRVLEVKLQATGAIRNISAVRDPRVCEIMVQDDCLTPVLTLLDRMTSATPASSNPIAPVVNGTPTADNDGKTKEAAAVAAADFDAGPSMTAAEQEVQIMEQLVATLCNLLAAVDVAVGRFTKQGGLQVVMRLLVPSGCRGSAEVFGGTLQALHVATDSNADFAAQLAALPGAVDQLSALVRGADVAHVKVSTAMRVQAAGVLVNVAGLSADASRSASDQTELSRLVLPLLLQQMSYDPAALEDACVTLAAGMKPAAEAESMDVDGDGGAGSGNGSADGTVGGSADASTKGAAAQVAAGVAAGAPMRLAEGAVNADGDGRIDAARGDNHSRAPAGAHRGAHGVGRDAGDEENAAAMNQPDLDAQLRWGWKLSVAEPLKLTAEVMANLCALAAGEDGEEDEEDEEWGSDDEDAMEQAASIPGGRGDQLSGLHGGHGDSCTVLLEAMTEGGALQRTLATLQALLSPTPRDRNLPVSPATSGEVGSVPLPIGQKTPGRQPLPCGAAGDLADLRATVALCAANLVQNLPAKALGENSQAVWTELCGMCEAAVQRAPSCVETLTGVMWGFVRRGGPAIAGVALTLATNSLPLLLRLCDPEVTGAFEARVNAVGMLGALGSAAAVGDKVSSGAGRDADEADVRVGRALVQAMEDPHVLVQAEALNAIMDVYGDDYRDGAFRASGAPAALASGVPAFRRKFKQEGKPLGRDALCHLKETALNASRFVKYKQAAEASVGESGRR